MEFGEAFGVTCKLIHETGRELYLENLNQCRTYLGLSCGLPNKRINDTVISWGRRDAASVRTAYGEPYVIPPERRDYDQIPGDMDDLPGWQGNSESRRHAGLAAEWLPSVRCIACFMSIAPARDNTKDASGLIVVWFQADFAFPIAEEIIDSIRILDWNSLATDIDLD